MRFVEDYPRNRAEFEARFSTEAACREYLVKLRWPDGFWCPRCGGRKSWPVRGVLLQCAGCGHQSSVTAGTIFQDTRKPLTLWFRAMWAVTSQKNGASAIGIQLRYGLDLAAQIAASHGATGSGSPRGIVGSRRDLLGQRRGRDARAANREQGAGGDCCARRWERDRTHSHAAYPRCVGSEPHALCGGRH